jgi:hypothetical protein
VLRDTVFDAFIELNTRADEVLDVNSLVLQKQFNCYCFLPHLAWVEVAYSDAQQKPVDHWYLRESLVLFGPQVDRLLSDTTIVFAYGKNDCPENLEALLKYYDHFFSPHVAIMIVEQGREPALHRDTWPANCDYVFLNDDGDFDPQRCFAAGMERADANRQYFMLSNSDIYLETLDIRANLRMLERYDRVTGFSHFIDLSPEASAQLRSTRRTSGLEINGNSTENNGHCQFLNRRTDQLRVFHSPNVALRLSHF